MNLAEAIEELAAVVDRLDRHVDHTTDALESHLRRLEGSVEDHIEDAECAEGLFDQVMDEAPRLAHEIKWLTADHVSLRSNVEGVISSLENQAQWEDVSDRTHALLLQLREHCHRSMALAQDAYGLDVGTGD